MKTRVRQLVFTIAMLGCVLIATRDTSTYTAGYCTCFREFQGDSLHAYIYSDTPVDWNFLASEDFTPFQLGGATEYEGSTFSSQPCRQYCTNYLVSMGRSLCSQYGNSHHFVQIQSFYHWEDPDFSALTTTDFIDSANPGGAKLQCGSF